MSKSINKQGEAIKDYFSLNNIILSSNEFASKDSNINPSFYEVIRIIDGTPLFFEEHIKRLWDSIELLGYSKPYEDSLIKENIYRLIEKNKTYNNNVKIIINGLDQDKPNLFLYFIKSSYPGHEEYAKGVPSILYKAERENPNAKIVASSFREKVNASIKSANVYEALLVNTKDQITEGSRSNMFFVKDKVFYTPPAKDVLVGITRTRVIQICNQLGYKLSEEPIHVDFLEEIDGLFLTGTSPKVLPISSIDNKEYKSSSNNAIQSVSNAYNELINNYIEKNKESMD